MKRQWKQIAAICFCLCFASGAFAKRVPFKRMLDIEKVRKYNLDAEFIKETGDLKIYYRDENDQVKFLIYHPSNKVDVVVSTTVEKLDGSDRGSGSQSKIQRGYRYRYKVASAKTSQQSMRTMVLEMTIPKTAPVDVKPPKGWYFRRNQSPMSYNWVRWSGLPRAPHEKSTYVAPGGKLEGFTLDGRDCRESRGILRWICQETNILQRGG